MQTTEKLAIHGGTKTITQAIPPYSPLGAEEKAAVARVMDSGVLSKYLGAWGDDFYGGTEVLAFEAAWAKFFQVPYAVSVNSATSGLMAAIGALPIEPQDEVIVSPWTMSATATAILVWNAIPVFADIEPDMFCLDVKSIEKKISKRTKAIVVTDIFGQPAALGEIMALAKKHGLYVIEDAAQAPGGKYGNQFTGTVADIGVFSLNYHKHIHTGEGGVCVTRNKNLADRMQLIRNHAEAVVEKKPTENFANLIGFNFRLGELEAAIGSEQLKKLPRLLGSRQEGAAQLTKELAEIPGLQLPVLRPNTTHAYYVYPLVLSEKILQTVNKKKIVAALVAEGVPGMGVQYQNIHLLPMYTKRIAYGTGGYPWKSAEHTSTVVYGKGTCPVAEHLQDQSLIYLALCAHRFNNGDLSLVTRAFHKVFSQLGKL